METYVRKKRLLLYLLIVIVVVCSASIITAGYLYYRHYQKRFQVEVEHQLSAIAELKVNELRNWRNERLANASVFYKNAYFSDLVKRFFEKPDDTESHEQLRTWLSKLLETDNYDLIMLLDTSYSKKMMVPNESERINSFVSQSTSEILRSGKVAFEDFYWNEDNQKIYLKVLVPILDEANANRIIGILALRISPEKYLYPFINNWPTPSQTAETLLVRREGNEVVFLNELRFKKNSALLLRYPLEEQKELPAVKAVLGYEGIVKGLDYRGVPVIAYVCAIPDSPWFIVTRMDISEVYGPLTDKLQEIIIFVIILLASGTAGGSFIWRQQNLRLYKQKAMAAGEWRTTFDSITDLVSIIDKDYKIKRVNKAFADVFGLHPKEVIGRSCYELVCGKKEPYQDCPYKKSLLTQKSVTVEYFNTYLNKYLEVSTSPVLDDKGEVISVVHIARDITDRKKADESLKISEGKFRAIFNNSTDGIIITDLETKRFHDANKNMCRMLGYSLEELKMLGVTDIHPKEHLTYVMEQLKKHSKDSLTPAVDLPMKRKDGSIFYASVLGTKMTLAEKDYMVAIFRDITERKKNEEEILWKTTLLEAQLNSTIDGILIVDNKGKKILQNQRCTELWKIPEDIVANNDDNKQVEFVKNSTKDQVKFVERVAYLYAHPDEISQDEVELKDGRVFDRYSAPVIGKNGINFGRIWSFRDITVRKQTEEKINNALKQAKVANEAKSLFLANMSHEIRTPMNAIMGFCQILSDEKLTSEQADYINIIHDSSKHLLQVINDILDFSKIEAGKMDIKIAECDLKHLFSTVESMMRSAVLEKGLEFNVRLGNGLPLNIRTDPSRLQQSLINLVNNAIKFTDKGYVNINVSLENRNNLPYIRFDVEDTGIGISAEKQKELFKSFSQIDASHSRKYGGTGLGLAITKQLAELLNGEITVSSEEGKGSIFSLTIPAGLDVTKQPVLDRDDSASKIDISKEKQQHLEFSGHVLVAEDVKTNQLLVKSILNQLGLEVTIAADGNEAIQKALSRDFDLILMDIQMPTIDGYEAAKVLRKEGIKTPIIALTAHAMKGDDNKCIEAGCDDYLTKPLDRRELQEKICKYLLSDNQIFIKKTDSAKSQVDELTNLCCDQTDQLSGLQDKADPEEYEGIISWDHLIAGIGDEELIREVIPTYLADNKDLFEKLTDAIKTGNAKEIHLYSHAIKGAARNLGVKRLSDIAGRLECAGEEGDVKMATLLFDELKPELEKLLTFLSRPDWIEIAKSEKVITD